MANETENVTLDSTKDVISEAAKGVKTRQNPSARTHRTSRGVIKDIQKQFDKLKQQMSGIYELAKPLANETINSQIEEAQRIIEGAEQKAKLFTITSEDLKSLKRDFNEILSSIIQESTPLLKVNIKKEQIKTLLKQLENLEQAKSELDFTRSVDDTSSSPTSPSPGADDLSESHSMGEDDSSESSSLETDGLLQSVTAEEGNVTLEKRALKKLLEQASQKLTEEDGALTAALTEALENLNEESAKKDEKEDEALKQLKKSLKEELKKGKDEDEGEDKDKKPLSFQLTKLNTKLMKVEETIEFLYSIVENNQHKSEKVIDKFTKQEEKAQEKLLNEDIKEGKKDLRKRYKDNRSAAKAEKAQKITLNFREKNIVKDICAYTMALLSKSEINPDFETSFEREFVTKGDTRGVYITRALQHVINLLHEKDKESSAEDSAVSAVENSSVKFEINKFKTFSSKYLMKSLPKTIRLRAKFLRINKDTLEKFIKFLLKFNTNDKIDINATSFKLAKIGKVKGAIINSGDDNGNSNGASSSSSSDNNQ